MPASRTPILLTFSFAVAIGVAVPSTARAEPPETVGVRFTAEGRPLGLLVRERGQLYGLCDAPCELRLPEGNHELYLRSPGREPLLAGRIDVTEPIALEGRYESRRGRRTAGRIWIALGLGASAYLLGFGGSQLACDAEDFVCVPDIGVGLVTAGAIVLTATVVGGSILATRSDRAHLRAYPLSPD